MLPIFAYAASTSPSRSSPPAGAVFAVWVANRKRIAAETIGRAEEQAPRLVKDAERDAETRKKEALLEAKEKAHDILMRGRAAGARRSASRPHTLEQTLARREAPLAERQAADRAPRKGAARPRPRR